MKKRILVTGANGLLGSSLIGLSKRHELFGVDVRFEKESVFQLDLRNKNDVKRILDIFAPEIIIHTAAYTDVDRAELEQDKCFSTNVESTKNLVELCDKKTKVVYISTDYVFDGENGPYSEGSLTNPISFYGKTKLMGEDIVNQSGLDNLIIRTTVLYGKTKKNDFVRWVKTNLESEKKINVVSDQYGNPTLVNNLAEGIYFLIERNGGGLFNIAGTNYVNRYEFAKKIAKFYNLNEELIIPIKTKGLNQLAKRPLKGGLKMDKIINYGFTPCDIEDGLKVIG